MYYPAKFEQEDSNYNVTFRDIPEAITCGDDWNDAINMAEDALLTAMDFYFKDHRQVPMPSELQKDEVLVTLPVRVFAKILLLNTMIEQNISNIELAKRLKLRSQEVQQIIDPKHSTKIDMIARALSAIGKGLKISVI